MEFIDRTEGGIQQFSKKLYFYIKFNYKLKSTSNIYNGIMKAIKYPTDNCQLSSLGSAFYIKYFNEEQIEMFKLLCKKNLCKQILIDIKQNDLDLIKQILINKVVFIVEQEYTSTNGSKMVLCIFKWKE